MAFRHVGSACPPVWLGEDTIMKLISSRKAALGAGTALLLSLSTAAMATEDEFKGMIVQSDGSTIVVRSDGGDKIVQVTPGTRIRSTGGALGMNRNEQTSADLLRGLAVE